jgi:hypothetical protein
METCDKFLVVVSGRIVKKVIVLKTFKFFSVELISVDLLKFAVSGREIWGISVGLSSGAGGGGGSAGCEVGEG